MDKDHISQLIYEKITGIISQRHDEILTNILSEDPEAECLFHEMMAEYIVFSANPDLKSASSGTLMAIKQRIQNKKLLRQRTRRIIVYSSVAALFIPIVILITLFIHRKDHQGIVNSRKPIPKILQLQLSDGKIIDLSHISDSIEIGDTKLNIDTLNYRFSFENSGKSNGQLNTLTIPAGIQYQLTLSDGSKIHLNSLTTLLFPFQFIGKREITIEGEAYLEIMPSKMPFIVHTSGGTINVLGTTFNINTYQSGKVKVSLEVGKVTCTNENGCVTLEEGNSAILDNNDDIRVEELNKDDLSWLKGIYKFHHLNAEQYVTLIYRIYGIQVILDDMVKGRKTVFAGGIDKNETLERSLEDVKKVTQLNYHYKDGEWHLY